MRIRDLMAAAVAAIFFFTVAPASAQDTAKASKPAKEVKVNFKTTADHSKFKELNREFASGPEVTKACLGCHTEASKQIHQTQHWKWEYISPDNNQLLGKRHVVNNYCTSVESNFAACSSCHIGYGMKDNKFDFTVEENVDCLACHDNTNKYTKPGGFAGLPVAKDTEYPPGSGKIIRGIDLQAIAKGVGKTTRNTCGACHFKGGGGDGVKHGDLDSSLEFPDKDLDVHMDVDGLNFTCATCHKTEGHQVPGSRYNPTAKDSGAAHIRGQQNKGNPATCQACHGQAPHQVVKLNDHTKKIACQTCHIPEFSRGGVATKMTWDWSTAGRRDASGKQVVVRDDEGNETYNSKKGDFTWGENVRPEYLWFNGVNKYTLITDKIEKANEPIAINRFEGSATDGKSLIWPVKIMRGKQQYDRIEKNLVITELAPGNETAYWKNLDWKKAVTQGMIAGGIKFSGEVDFIATESHWAITHMVAPKEKAVGCVECHMSNGRLEKIDGVYMPGRGRDHAPWLEIGGWLLAALVLLGVTGHGIVRVISRKRNS